MSPRGRVWKSGNRTSSHARRPRSRSLEISRRTNVGLALPRVGARRSYRSGPMGHHLEAARQMQEGRPIGELDTERRRERVDFDLRLSIAEEPGLVLDSGLANAGPAANSEQAQPGCQEILERARSGAAGVPTDRYRAENPARVGRRRSLEKRTSSPSSANSTLACRYSIPKTVRAARAAAASLPSRLKNQTPVS